MKRALSLLIMLTAAIGAATAAPPADSGGAKGMFYQQLQRPTEKLNNGVQYWIELKRSGQVSRVSNKLEFRSGDQIRFHVRTNTNGYAYVVLREGSRGEHAVLFPDPRHADDIRVNANTEYALPGDGYLLFDENPGQERVTIVLARQPINTDKQLQDKNKVIIASRIDGSKDLVPGSFVISYGKDDPAPNLPSNTGLATEKPPVIPTQHTTPAVVPIPPAHQNEDPSAIITVVQKNPADALALDICLEHKP